MVNLSALNKVGGIINAYETVKLASVTKGLEKNRFIGKTNNHRKTRKALKR